MASLLIFNIGKLVNVREHSSLLRNKDLAHVPAIDQAWLLCHNDRIADFGSMANCPYDSQAEQYDAGGGYLLPAWCDSHTHLVFAASREGEFVDKIRGLSYADIAARGGGILQSARQLATTPEEELFQLAMTRLLELARLGTGAVEIKSGYGLSVEAELKMLRVIRRLKAEAPQLIKATFLGAHAFPEAFRENREGYIDLIIREMLPQIAAEGLADYIDVFCETGFFSPADTLRIGRAGAEYGLRAKIHANQLNVSGGVQAGVELGALSVDHLESMDEAAIHSLSGSPCIGTLLPAAAFFLRMSYPPARQLIEAGAALALATDFNPGSAPSGNMNLVISLACIQMRMLPEEAINAASIQGAFAMELEQEVGSITRNKKANFILTSPLPTLAYIPYSFGSNLIKRVMLNGKWV